MTAPAVAHTELFSYLVTRHTGRAVRSNIERELAKFDRAVLAVLDMRHVPVIDFSCADEVVAKLVIRGPEAVPGPRRFFLFRGIAEHHLEPIECALSRQGLAAAGESVDGDPMIIGRVERAVETAWREIWAVGLVGAAALASRLGTTEDAAGGVLSELDSRRLVIRDGDRYVSFGRALEDARRGGVG